MTEREMPGMRPRYAAVDAAKVFVTPEFIKNCADKLAKEYPTVTIVSNFFLSPAASQRAAERLTILTGSNYDLVALVAIFTNEGLFGQQVKTVMGCTYRLENGGLVFQAAHGPGYFGSIRNQ